MIGVLAGCESARTGVVVAGFVTTGVNVGSGNGADTGAGAGAGARGGTETTTGASFPAKTVPFSRLTRFSGAILPAKNSAAVRDGSEDGAGG